MIHCFENNYGNASSSSHIFGWNAKSEIELAYEELSEDQKKLLSKYPTQAKLARAKFLAFIEDSGEGEGVITWNELSDQMKIEEQKFSDMEYARKRKDEYPDLAEQLDLLWHAIDAGTLDDRDHRNKFYSTLKEVKTNNPKG